MAEQLKPCFYCGEADALGIETDRSIYGRYYFGFCNECESHGPACDTEDDAAIAWNTRKGEG